MEQEKTEVVEETTKNEVEETPLTFDEILGDKDYQREFDKRVAKALETAKEKWTKDAELQKTEAEKLAKMNAEQQMKYQLDKASEENALLKGKLNAIELYKTASGIATEKSLPIEYLDLVDFSKETAESITSKIDKIQEIREKDLQLYLNNKLKQPTPKEKKEVISGDEDPYVKGFKEN